MDKYQKKECFQVEGWGDDDRGLAGCKYRAFNLSPIIAGWLDLFFEKGTCGPKSLAM